ncbi:MAG TPA: galactokinase family protein [Anaerolineae bacterium]|nr:galactokinase family protein [Anaerolineae bacterium]
MFRAPGRVNLIGAHTTSTTVSCFSCLSAGRCRWPQLFARSWLIIRQQIG